MVNQHVAEHSAFGVADALECLPLRYREHGALRGALLGRERPPQLKTLFPTIHPSPGRVVRAPNET